MIRYAHCCSASRREFLGAVGALGAGALLGGVPTFAQAPATRRVDIHHHFGSPDWIRMTAERQSAGFEVWQKYSPARSIEDMDRGGVEVSYISITTPGIWFGDLAETRRVARRENEYGARIAADSKGRLKLLAVLPLPDVEASLREIDYAFDTLKADGVGLLSNWGKQWLGDAAFRPVLEELNRRGAVVYTHGSAPGCCGGEFVPGVSETTAREVSEPERIF